jgi:hypothetical protein
MQEHQCGPCVGALGAKRCTLPSASRSGPRTARCIRCSCSCTVEVIPGTRTKQSDHGNLFCAQIYYYYQHVIFTATCFLQSLPFPAESDATSYLAPLPLRRTGLRGHLAINVKVWREGADEEKAQSRVAAPKKWLGETHTGNAVSLVRLTRFSLSRG